MLNQPDLWIDKLPRPSKDGHKYMRGHVIVVGGAMAGATRLAALAALRAGAGVVTLVCPPENYSVNATALTSVIVRPMPPEGIGAWLEDSKVTAVIFGPGAGTEHTRQYVLEILRSGKPAVLDADALTLFEGNLQQLLVALHPNIILTPHSGEFQRLFGIPDGSKEGATLKAAAECNGAVIVHKGAQTIIAIREEQYCINEHATPWLATAGTGDVLAGICGGLIGQGMPAFEAACAAAWMQGDAAIRLGPGFIAEDLPAMLPHVWQGLLDRI